MCEVRFQRNPPSTLFVHHYHVINIGIEILRISNFYRIIRPIHLLSGNVEWVELGIHMFALFVFGNFGL